MRTIVDIPDRQLALLGAWCEREKISRAEAVRRALDTVLSRQQVGRGEASFGAWKRRKNAGALVRSMREEWEQ